MGEFGQRRFGGRPGGFRRNFGPREMHKATCSECKKECEVPFKPMEGRPVLCKECYMKQKGFTKRNENPEEKSEDSEDSFEEAA